MPTVRVYLECTSPTRRPSGLYDTFVTVSKEEWAAGEHLRTASRRAAILGYGGPHLVREVRRLDALVPGEHDAPTVARTEDPDQTCVRTSERLERLMAAADRDATTDQGVHEARSHEPPVQRRAAAPRGRATAR